MSRAAVAGWLAALFSLSMSPGEAPTLRRHTTDGLPKQRPAWSPDGKLLAFARHEDGGLHIRQYVGEVDKPGSFRRLTQRKEPEYDAAFLTDGRSLLLVVVKLSGTQGNLDLAQVGVEGGEPKAWDIDGGKLSHQEWPSPSPDGKRTAFSSTHERNQEIYTADLDGKNIKRITQNPGTDAHPCWTPDGQALIFATDRWGGLELARCAPDGSSLVRLTNSRGLDDYPAVSPDGRLIAFVSNRDGQFEVYVSNLDGSAPRNLSNHPGRDTLPTWTRDGKGVTFVSARDTEADIYTISFESPKTKGQ